MKGQERKHTFLINIILAQAFIVVFLYVNYFWSHQGFLFEIPRIIFAIALIAACMLPLASVIIARAVLEFGKKEATSRILQQRAAFVLESISSGVIATDSDGRVTYANQAVLDLFKVNPEDVLQRHISRLIKDIGKTLDSSSLETSGHEVVIEREGKNAVLLIDVGLLKQDNAIVGNVLLLKDMTEVRSLQDKIMQQERLTALGEVAAMAAHEIRNPLTAIRGFMQILRSRATDQNDIKYLDLVVTEADRMNNLVRQMVVFSKPARELEEMVDINKLIEESLLLTIDSDSHNVNHEQHLEPGLPDLMLKRDEMKQVFVNLIRNGVEAMPDGGLLTITSEMRSDEACIAIYIQDTGHGIPLRLHDQIFHPFVTTKARGLGLGLAICDKIVREHGGQITLASSKDRGTTFNVLLPLPSWQG